MKLINNTDTVMTLREVTFPPGEPVNVMDEDLAAKCDAMPEFSRAPVAKKAKANAKNEG